MQETNQKYPAKAAEREQANNARDFVKNYLLKYKPTGCENYGQAFKDAKSIIDETEDTVIIFLCDGQSADNGASSITKDLKASMGKKLSLFCITLGPGTYNNDNATVKAICDGGKGKMEKKLHGNELGMQLDISFCI